jgi:hypothetical protein
LYFPLGPPLEDIEEGKRGRENPCLFKGKSDNICDRLPFYGIDQLLMYEQCWMRRTESG